MMYEGACLPVVRVAAAVGSHMLLCTCTQASAQPCRALSQHSRRRSWWLQRQLHASTTWMIARCMIYYVHNPLCKCSHTPSCLHSVEADNPMDVARGMPHQAGNLAHAVCSHGSKCSTWLSKPASTSQVKSSSM
jgi:hypothetical protein